MDHYQYRIVTYSAEFGIERWHDTPEQFAAFVAQMDGDTHQEWGPREWTKAYGLTATKHGDEMTLVREWDY